MQRQGNLWDKLKAYGYEAVDLLFPNQRCMVCGKPSRGAYLCAACRQKREKFVWGRCCERCGTFIYPTQTLCRWCQIEPPLYIKNAKAVAPYGGYVRDGLLAMKYEGKKYLARGFGLLLVDLVKAEYPDIRFDLVCSVPVTPSTLKKRGYNQSLLLAEQVAYGLGLPCADHLLKKRTDVLSQTALGRNARITNMQNAIIPTDHDLSGNRILLVDDIFTTGATAYACGRNLLQMGAAGVWVITVAAGSEWQCRD